MVGGLLLVLCIFHTVPDKFCRVEVNIIERPINCVYSDLSAAALSS